MMNVLLESVFPKYCVVCERLGDFLCDNCRSCVKTVSSSYYDKNAHYDFHRAVFVFNDVLKKLIHDFKYNHEFWLKNFFNPYLFQIKHYFSDVDVAVPVPLHLKQLRRRGYNQSLHLAKLWSEVLHKPVDFSSLSRVKDTLSQTGLDKKARQKNLKGAFVVTDDVFIRDKKILLVDDVHTTGATLSEVARVLKRSGAASVLATSIAIVT